MRTLFYITIMVCIFVGNSFGDETTINLQGRHIYYDNYTSKGNDYPRLGKYVRGGTGGYSDEILCFGDLSSLNGVTIDSAKFWFKISDINTGYDSRTADLYEQNKKNINQAFVDTATFLAFPDVAWSNFLGSKYLAHDAAHIWYSIKTASLKNLVQDWADGTKQNDGLIFRGDFGTASYTWEIDNVKLEVYYTPQNYAPVASNVNITGIKKLGKTLMGNYTYSDAENDSEGVSIYKWYRADDSLGTNESVIIDENGLTYLLDTEDYTKYICFEVKPVAETGTSPGQTVKSSYVGPILGDLYVYPEICGEDENMKVDGKSKFKDYVEILEVQNEQNSKLELTSEFNGKKEMAVQIGNNWKAIGQINGFLNLYGGDVDSAKVKVSLGGGGFSWIDGYLGIGTDGPDTELDVVGTATIDKLTIDSTFTSGGDGVIYGNLGIGAPSSGEKLEVAGTVKAETFKIGEWTIETPDYVFEPSYMLRTLEEVEQFITDKKHLPGVPSAADMKRKGVDIAELSMILLMKIEELQLYILQQEKKLQSQQTEINDLRKDAGLD